MDTLINGNKYLTLVPTNESKDKIEKYEKLWSKIRELIRSIIKNSDDYGEKFKLRLKNLIRMMSYLWIKW